MLPQPYGRHNQSSTRDYQRRTVISSERKRRDCAPIHQLVWEPTEVVKLRLVTIEVRDTSASKIPYRLG